MRKRVSVYVLVLVLFMSFASCSKKSESTLQTEAGRISKPDVEIEPQSRGVGEPVKGAEIFIELEPDEEPIANVITNEDGYFEFTELPPPAPPFPNEGTFVFNILPSKEFMKRYRLDPLEKFKVSVPYSKEEVKPTDGKPKRILFQYLLEWKKPTKAENKGVFAVSRKNSTRKPEEPKKDEKRTD